MKKLQMPYQHHAEMFHTLFAALLAAVVWIATAVTTVAVFVRFVSLNLISLYLNKGVYQ